ncbi:MAG: methyltransferase domain-containing protein [Candidatus Hodarchaeales archaeon]|jgi:ubiquinone/menaquinone biosynthesis C-methylase UbiE
MVSRDDKIKADYAKRLKDAKALSSTSSSDSDIDQEINFGCLRLEGFITDFVKPGMTVIDFGSGPGHDLFLAARATAPNGRAIGVDMTEEMITEVEETARKRGIENVEMVKSRIEDIPLPDGIADVIISNCVICISSNKESVFKEAFRLLKPGGVLLDADLIANEPSPTGACTGALTMDGHEHLLRTIGFNTVLAERGSKDLVTHEQEGVYSGLISARKPVS